MAREEIELKFAVSAPAELRARARQLGFRVAGKRRRERNWIFDDAGGEVRSRGCLLRLRQSGEQWLLTVKGPRRAGPLPPQHARALGAPVLKRRAEAETEVADGAVCRQALELLGYRERMCYERFRTVLRRAGKAGELAWDETPMGIYLEIEGSAAWVLRTARELGLKAAAAEPRSYPELYAEFSAGHY